MDTTAVVETPERVRFRTRLAGVGPRSVAWLVDTILRGMALIVVGLVAVFASYGEVLAGLGQGVLLFALFLYEWGYFAICETAMRGQTPGKWLVGIRVVRTDGSPSQLSDYVLRNLMRAVDGAFLYLPGVLCMVFDPRFRRTGDWVAGTIVVREQRARVLPPVAIQPPVSAEERASLPVSVVLSRDERTLIEKFLRRKAVLSAQRAEELAGILGPALAERTGVEAPSWERVLTLAYARATGRERPGDDDGP